MTTRAKPPAERSFALLLRRIGIHTPCIAVFVLTVMACNFVAMPIISSLNRQPSVVVVSVMMGFFVGQLCFVAILGGLYGTSWIDGFLLGCLVGLLCLLAMMLGTCASEGWPPRELWASVLLVPGIVFVAIGPLLLMRHFSQWRLVASEETCPKSPASLGSMFLNIAAIASIVLISRAPQILWLNEPIDYWTGCGTIGLVMFLVAAVITLPTGHLLNCKHEVTLLTRLIVLGVTTSLLVVGVVLLLAIKFGSPGGDFFWGIPVVASVTTLRFYFGIRAIRKDGFRLKTARASNVDSAVEQPESNRSRKRTILQVSTIAVIMIGLNIILGRIQADRIAHNKLVSELRLLVEGGEHGKGTLEVYADERQIHRMYMPSANDEMLVKIMEKLQNANTMLDILDLSGSEVTDNCLDSIGKTRGLNQLNLSDTKVTGTGFARLSRLPLRQLVARQLDLSNADWSHLPMGTLRILAIHGATISPNDFASFLRDAKLSELNVSEVEIDSTTMDGIAYQAGESLTSLILAGTEVSDDDVRRLEGTNVQRLNLSKTKVTDTCIDSLLTMNGLSNLDLSRTEVTDAGIAKLGQRYISTLNLSRTRISGRCFEEWGSLPLSLNVSATMVGDEIADSIIKQHLVHRGHTNLLNLAETNITDAILSQLTKLSCNKVVITGTRLSSNALLKTDPRYIHQWEIGRNQFTRAERTALEMAVPGGFELVYAKSSSTKAQVVAVEAP